MTEPSQAWSRPKAVVVRAYDDLSGCVLEDVEPRPPGPGEVQIDCQAAGVAYADTMICRGLYQIRPAPPFVLGSESAGIVRAVGAGVDAFKEGDRVAATGFAYERIHGAYSQTITIPIANVLQIPDEMTFVEAAAYRSSYETAHYAFVCGHLMQGESVLVLGAGGGLGIAAIQLAKLIGARVIASASTHEKRLLAQQNGADETVATDDPEWRKKMDRFTAGKGLNVVFDPVGGEMTERAYRAVGFGGRHVVVGFASGTIPKLPVNLPLMKGSMLIGANLLRCWELTPESFAQNARSVRALYPTGALRPHIGGVYPLTDFRSALQAVAEALPAGRVVLDLSGT